MTDVQTSGGNMNRHKILQRPDIGPRSDSPKIHSRHVSGRRDIYQSLLADDRKFHGKVR
jgi:hypothetical protein